MRPALASLALVLLAACPSYTRMPQGTMMNIVDEREAGSRDYFLAQSMYAGRFWDDDRARLLSPRRFETLRHLQTVEGEPIPPPPPDDILPVGTRVRLEQVAFPTGGNVFRRPLQTPRYTTWVRLKILGGSGVVDRRDAIPHYLVLPAYLEDKEAFDAFLDAYLVREDPRPWLDALDGAHRRGVREKRAVVGMDARALTAALGAPDRVVAEDDGRERLLWAEHTAVVVEDGRVVSVDEQARLVRPVPR